MRKLLGTLVLIGIILAGVGFVRNWYTVEHNDEGDNTQVYLSINRDKIRTDTRDAADIARELQDNLERRIEERRSE